MALNHTVQGSVNYTIEGTPTIVDGVASGFSSSNYLTLPTTINLNNDFEVCFEFKFTSELTSSYYYLSSFRMGGAQSLELIHWENEDYVRISSPFNVGTGNLQVKVTDRWQLNTPYKVIWKRVGSTGYVYLYANDTLIGSSTKEYTTSADSLTEFVIGARVATYATPFSAGEINLNNSYIKSQGQAWFGVCPVEVKHIDYGTSVGYTKVGSPTIVNGVASGFGTDDYLQVEQQFNITNDKNVEIYVRAKTPSTITSGFNPIIDSENVANFGISSYSTALFTVRLANVNGTSYKFDDMYISGGVQTDTWYCFKITGNNGIWRAEVYNDNNVLLKSNDKDFTSQTFSADNTVKLRCTDKTYAYSGSIDLNNTYIKVNGKLWFYRPSTNYLVKDGKLVFADSDVYIDDNGTKTYASANVAPVPSGFTYGTTTTTDVGLVDMVTQAFTAVPGATWGKD